jgi:hypothetical protein
MHSVMRRTHILRVSKYKICSTSLFDTSLFQALLLLLNQQLPIIMPATIKKETQAQVVLVGCGAPNRGMGWYHAEQMLRGDIPSAALTYIVEPWFLGPGTFRSFVICLVCLCLSCRIS